MALVHCKFFSETLGLSTSMDVILPQVVGGRQIGMASASVADEHPCLLLLHGLSDDHTIWQRRTSIERYVAPLGLAVVMPNVHRSFYADMVNGLAYWTFISEELPVLARRFFRLSSRREDNFVAGLSMGGYGAFKLALRCPDRFAAAASLSGALDMASRVEAKEFSNDIRLVFGDAARVAGTADDLIACASRFSDRPDKCPCLYQCCGTEDHLYQDNLAFRKHATDMGLNLTYEEGPGAHEWGYWDTMIQRVLAWLPLADGGVDQQSR